MYRAEARRNGGPFQIYNLLYNQSVRKTSAARAIPERQGHRVKKQTPALTDLVRISEDEADGIISTQRLKKERRYGLNGVLRELGYKLEN
jgi:hypothetical protein